MGVQAKKKFGQNFISDPNLINKICNVLDSDKNMLVIEIGPGTGALTKELVKRFDNIIAIEIDADMEPILIQNINSPNFELIIGDILKIDLLDLIKKKKNDSNQKVSIISNLPYYITGEIIFKVLAISTNIDKAVFMMQKEVAKRLCANVSENNYNNLSIATQFYSERKYEFTVSKGMFKPIPKVDSAIISLTFNDKNLDKVKNDEEFIFFVRKLFNNKRKTILNNLANFITKDKQKAKDLLNKVNIPENYRPEQITLEQFISLFNSK